MMENGFSKVIAALGLAAGLFAAPVLASTHVPGEIVVRTKQVFSAQSAQATLTTRLAQLLGPGSVLSVDTFRTDGQFHKVKLADDAKLKQAIAALESDPSVQFAEPNFIFHAITASTNDGVPNDPDFPKLWGLQNTGQTDDAGQVGTPGSDIRVVPVWAEGIKGSNDIVVAVIDTGVDWSHPDLVDNLYTNRGESGPWTPANDQERERAPNCNDKSCNMIDDDGNGFVDDTHGWNFAAKSRNSSDDHNHGTHCAGTIGATGDNGVGVVGVSQRVTILPIKFLTASGSGTLEGAVQAVQYATKMGVQVMSNSWGGGSYTESLKLAIEEARDQGIVFVAAAGNDRNNNDARPSYPASYAVENVISVAATDNQDKLASFTNTGKTSVHVAAPGVQVYSTVRNGGYKSYSGTSMACPHVAGLVALMLSHDSSLDYAEVKSRLIRTSDPVRALRNKVVANGRVNAYNAIHNIVPPSDAPDESLWKTIDHEVESKHPYDTGSDEVFTIHHPGAKYIRVIFEKVAMERGYDKLVVKDGAGSTIEELTGNYTNYTSDYVKGDTVVLNLRSDHTINDWGFAIKRIQVVTD